MSINDLVTEVLQRWVQVAGIDTSVLDPKKRTFSVSWGEGVADLRGTHNQRKHLDMLHTAWDLDPTGITVLMLIRGYFEE